jgi:hypothetical protein
MYFKMKTIYIHSYGMTETCEELGQIRRPGNVFGMATAYGLGGRGIEYRWGARFSAPAQTGSEVHPASCTMGTGSFPGVRCDRSVTLTPDPLLVPRSKIV